MAGGKAEHLGLIASSVFELPTGAVIVVTLLAVFVITVIVANALPAEMRAEPAAA